MKSMISVQQTQQPLRQTYKQAPDMAMITDHARSGSAECDDPFHSQVEPMDGCGVQVPVGMHRALGGPHDAPTPGDLLCAALAACQDMSIRMVANLMGIELLSLQVAVRGTLDVRGALGVIDARTGGMAGSGVTGDGIDAKLLGYRDRLAAQP